MKLCLLQSNFHYRIIGVWLICTLSFGIFAGEVSAKGSAPVYEDPFDIASGGASLTRASQAGMMFSNPALIPYGPGFHRWAGNESTFIVGKDSVDFARSLQKSNSSSDSSADGGKAKQVEFINNIMKTPLHAGVLNNFSYINRLFGFSTFNRAEVDISAKKYGDTGLPSIRFRAESCQGAGISLASMVFTRVLSVGATAKYIYAGEPDLSIDLTDQEAIKKLQSPTGLKALVGMNRGIGYDVGALIFLQGYSNDLRIAFKADDVGGTNLKGDADLKELKQVYSLGLGYTLHNGTDAIHLSLDYRDVQKSYDEEMFKRVRIGSKILIRNHFGIGIGYYDGWPSYGLELDAWIVRLSAAYYTKEMGAKPGIDPRPAYALGFTMGF